MWTALRTRPHSHRLDDYDYYDEDCVALLHHLTGLIRAYYIEEWQGGVKGEVDERDCVSL